MNEKPKTFICQSCGMTTPEQARGTNADSTLNENYCRFCFMEGKFMDPNITKEEMIDKVAETMAQRMNSTKEQSHNMAKKIVSALDRWQEETKEIS